MMLALLASLALADEGFCPVTDTLLDDEAWLRSLSLDLRGVIPSPEEYEALADRPIEDFIADWMETEAFTEQVVRHHRALLWPNVADIRLLSNRQRLLYEDGVYYRYLVAPNYRGGPVSCGDFEAAWDQDGELITTTTEDGYLQEGWVEVHPYWAPDSTIKVCAFEAQEDRISPRGTACDTYDGRFDPYCGCGPHLAWCDTFSLGHNGDNPNPPVAKAIAGDIEHRIAKVIDEDQSYLEILLGKTMFVNGPLAHFYRYQTRVPAHVRFNEVPVDPAILPELAFTDEDTWVEVPLGDEQAGILTSTFYLMKFQTRRSRANRFYNAFLCQPFTPPDGGIQNLDDPHATLDLSKREGCDYCHALLEPAGAHWGRWGEYGAGYTDPDTFPTYDEDCAWCAETGAACSEACSTYYLVDPLASEEDPYVGMLRSYEFMEDRYLENIEVGPKLLVDRTVVDGRLPVCVAEKTAAWLLGRDIEAYEEPWIQELAESFVASGFRYRQLITDIVTSESYRSVR